LSVAITGSGSSLVFREKIEITELAGVTSSPVFAQLNPTRAAPRTMIITAGGFSEGAKQVARLRNVTPIFLIDGDRLTDMLIEHEIGVRKETVEVVTFAPERLEEEEL
jgi:restriction endonuclease Mrr